MQIPGLFLSTRANKHPWFGGGSEAQESRTYLFSGFQWFRYKAPGPSWLECDVTDATWAHEWNTACVILVSDPWRYFYTLSIWHLRDEKCVLLHNEFCVPDLWSAPEDRRSASASSSGCWSQFQGKAAKSRGPPLPASLSESQGSGWNFQKEPRPVRTLPFGVCFRGLS